MTPQFSPRSLVKALLVLVAFTANSDVIAQDSVRFTKGATKVGEQLQQSVQVGMSLKTQTIQKAEVVEQADLNSERRQQRVVTVESLGKEGLVTTALVEFQQSERSRNGATEKDPIVGKSYRCTRKGEELLVTKLDGTLPPLQEYRIVTQAMESLGKPNALADYLSGRVIQVGQQLSLPPEVAKNVIGFGKRIGEVDRFEITLQSIQPDGTALFMAEIEAHGTSSSQMRMVAAGQFLIDTQTCRTKSAELSGPIGLSEARGSATHKYLVNGTGKIRMALSSQKLPERQ